jgi:threonine synthase
MLFQSTRQDPTASTVSSGFAQALVEGLAPDGGLYVPQQWPVHQPAQLCARIGLPPEQYLTAEGLARIGALLLEPLVRDSELASQLPAITAQAFSFPAPLVPLQGAGRLGVLELFHGPTAAFKDFGARFLAACLSRLRRPGQRPLNILVATSGDTGGAVAAAFHRLAGVQVAVLFPKGLV